MPLSDKTQHEIEAFIETVNQKTQQVVDEFAAGHINREQFHHLYERYSHQLEIAREALQTGSADVFYGLRNTDSSMIIRNIYQGKAKGLLVFHHKSSAVLQTLGDFDLPVIEITRKLKDIAQSVMANRFVDWESLKLDDNQWVLFEPGKYTTVVTLFVNEPSQQQSQEIARMHRDFEAANRAMLDQPRVNAYQLAYPFAAFVQRKPAQD